MRFNQNDLEELRQIHYNETGVVLSDTEVLEMGIRLVNLIKVVGRKIPKSNQELDE